MIAGYNYHKFFLSFSLCNDHVNVGTAFNPCSQAKLKFAEFHSTLGYSRIQNKDFLRDITLKCYTPLTQTDRFYAFCVLQRLFEVV